MSIAQINNKWYVVKSKEIGGSVVWFPISQAFDNSYDARAELTEYVFGRK